MHPIIPIDQLGSSSISLDKHRKLFVEELRVREREARVEFTPAVIVDILRTADPEAEGRKRLNSQKVSASASSRSAVRRLR